MVWRFLELFEELKSGRMRAEWALIRRIPPWWLREPIHALDGAGPR
jgi:hypothetical protein